MRLCTRYLWRHELTRAHSHSLSIMSSPKVPSIEDLIEQRCKPRIASGSHAASIPDSAALGFTKASEIHRAQFTPDAKDDMSIFDSVTSDGESRGVSKHTAAVELRDSSGSSHLTTEAMGVSSKRVGRPRKKQSIEGAESVGDKVDTALVCDRPKRRQSKKSEGAGQSKIAKGKIKKANVKDKDSKDGSTEQKIKQHEAIQIDPVGGISQPTAESFGAISRPSTPGKSLRKPVDETLSLGLEKAGARRKDWTPVRDKENIEIVISPEPEEIATSESQALAGASQVRTTFGKLATSFVFKHETELSSITSGVENVAPHVTKRRRIEASISC
jgi:hypothetical protein